MGIKGLTQLIKKYSPDSITHTKLYKLSGKTVALDASLYIYQSLIMYRYNNDFIRNKAGDNISHIIGIINKTINCLSLNITPIYIFDGVPPIEKKEVINERKAKACVAMDKINSSNTSSDDVEKYKKQSIRLTKEIINDIKKVLQLLGVSYIDSQGEAEGYASELCRIKYVDYVMSEDMDCLPFNCSYLIRNCIDKSIKITDTISIFDQEKILKDLEMTQDQFIELCILCGCDYCSNIPRIGSLTAYKIIKKHNTIENYLNDTNNKNIPDNYRAKYLKSKELFKIYYNNIDINNIDAHHSTINITDLMNYLSNYCNLSNKKIQTYLYKIQNKYVE